MKKFKTIYALHIGVIITIFSFYLFRLNEWFSWFVAQMLWLIIIAYLLESRLKKQ